MAPIAGRRNMWGSWARSVLISGSRRAELWCGAYSRRPQVRTGEHLPAPMWGRVAQSALASASAPMSCSAEPDVRSPCSRFPSRARLGSTCLWAFQVSRLRRRDEVRATAPSVSIASPRGFDQAFRFEASHQRTFDENHRALEDHQATAGHAWTVAAAGRFVGRFRFRANGPWQDDQGKADGQACQARERLREGHQEVLPYAHAG